MKNTFITGQIYKSKHNNKELLVVDVLEDGNIFLYQPTLKQKYKVPPDYPLLNELVFSKYDERYVIVVNKDEIEAIIEPKGDTK
jgi:hypothetical protein